MLTSIHHTMKKFLFFLIISLTIPCFAQHNGLQLPECYTSGMVLLHNRPLTITGTANSGEKVSLSINGRTYNTVTEQNGKWKIKIAPLPTGGPYAMTVSTEKEKKELTNILAGEVWLCSGQSNMAFMLKECNTGATDIPLATNPNIRILNYQWIAPTYNLTFSLEQLDAINHLHYMKPTRWRECAPENAADMSAIAYYFAQAIQDSLDIPIGIINNAVGGSGIESWIDRNTMSRYFPIMLDNWVENEYIMDWSRERAKLNMGTDRQPNQRHPFEPCYMYEANIDMLTSLNISGVLWYQGESNAHDIESHAKMFKMLVHSWRQGWNNKSLPFYYIQLSSLNRPTWPAFRDSQRKLYKEISHSGMVVSSDLGDSTDVHYKYKKPLGKRLANLALHDTYGRRSIIPSGPMFKKATSKGNKVYVSFDNGNGMHASNGNAIIGFELAEDESHFYPADATIQGNKVILNSELVSHPRYVRYAFQPFTRANLVNSSDLPASTFYAKISKN